MLWAEAESSGYACPIWMTFQQAKELGGYVRKGEHGTPVVYASKFTKTETGDDGAESQREIPFLRSTPFLTRNRSPSFPATFTS
jgi:antirestriction protein ArdC